MSPRQQQAHHRSTPLRFATLPDAGDAGGASIGIFCPPIRGSERLTPALNYCGTWLYNLHLYGLRPVDLVEAGIYRECARRSWRRLRFRLVGNEAVA